MTNKTVRAYSASLVSVIIPTFNHGHYLGRALQSLLDQSYTNWEAIVIDNFSTDNTEELMYAFSDKRISYLKFRNNGVIGASRNAGIRVARGEWVAFLDSDDWWHPKKLSELHAQSRKNLDVFYHELQIIRPRKSWRKRFIGSWQVRSPVQIDLLLRGNALATSSVVVRREVLNKTALFNENNAMVACEDYNLWLQLGRVTNNFKYCRKVLGYYMDDGKGMSNRDMSEPYKSAVAPFIHNLNPSQRKFVEARIHYQKLRHAYLNADYNFLMRSAMKSIVNGPLSVRIKSLVMYLISLVRRTP
jgi:glycosyltransferase involved in cell wall biosynthesis